MSSVPAFEDVVFRYRPISALLGEFAELEKQSIYFAKPEQLNDPIEGLRDFFWHGDEIVWRNFLRHYILCLQAWISIVLLIDDEEALRTCDVPVYLRLDNLPTDDLRYLCKRCIARIESEKIHKELLQLVSSENRSFSFSELEFLLRYVHMSLVRIVLDIFFKEKVVGGDVSPSPSDEDIISEIQKYRILLSELNENIDNSDIQKILDYFQSTSDQSFLLSMLSIKGKMDVKMASIYFDFPRKYLKSLSVLTYPPWSVACFSSRHDDAAMWSYYAGNHQGCCLVFRTSPSDVGRKIELNGPHSLCSSSGINYRSMDFSLRAVEYTSNVQRIEFFKNIGQLNFRALKKNWFQDDGGNVSPFANHLSSKNRSRWRAKFWEGYTPALLRKLPEWKHEQEYRIILPDTMGMYKSTENRIFTYDYSTLCGLIFGLNTPVSKKIEILNIIDRKRNQGNSLEDFKFYQARYDASSGKIVADHLFLLDIK